MDNYLLLSLGHNSSAIFVDNSDQNHQKIIGYEQERLSGIKADSQFPRDAINEIIKHTGSIKGCTVLISHWFNNGPDMKPNKYITAADYDWLYDVIQCKEIKMCGGKFTHHDAHAYSAYEFFKYWDKNNTKGPVSCLVVDGFGNNEEVLSLYTTDQYKGIKLVHRVYGYGASLGLAYQYATAFVGMKENQDEYKFLGYEAHIDEVTSVEQRDVLDHHIDVHKNRLVALFNSQTKAPEYYPENEVIDFKQLEAVRDKWYTVFGEVLNSVDVSEDYMHSYKARCIIAYFIQNLCENTLYAWLSQREEHINNLVVAGGVFYNVKLNNMLMRYLSSDESFCVMPLAGDQGAAIGMYAKVCERPFDFGTLCWGKRSMYNAKKLILQKYKDTGRVTYIKAKPTTDFKGIQKHIAELIANNNLVNLVFGNMEFGPRALCHTSTLFLPTVENVSMNNIMNGRNEVMPCAPVCTRENARELFECSKYESIDKVVGSDKYMICTHTYDKPYSVMFGGVMHKRPIVREFTGRPQIVDEGEFMYEVLKQIELITDYKAIVNTSFNVHGRPIAFDIVSIMQNYDYQCEHIHAANTDKQPYLVIIDIAE